MSWELKNEELQEREASLQKSTSSLIDREEDLKSWSSELESFQEKLNEKQEYITSCRVTAIFKLILTNTSKKEACEYIKYFSKKSGKIIKNN